MNMFKSRRKAKDQTETLEAPTGLQSPPMTYKTVKGLKRKNKTTPEETKPVFDLSTALPDDNDFRTSLLMPNLSARFSMLREQDDPNTKVGKASDDSVLFPKRVSRLNLFGHSNLADVAEVESVYSTFRPPFADSDRSNSVGDGYESDGGSMINRSRQLEGNNFFGGRQKLYKIATSSTRNLTNKEEAVPGRHVYEHDIPLPPVQQHKLKEREARTIVDPNRISAAVTEGGENSDIASPATAFSKKRGTQSSTNSGPRRSSTAATSVASESPAFRNSDTDNVAPRGQESAPATEIQSTLVVAKTRDEAIPNRFMSPPKHDRLQRPGPLSPSSMRNASSPPIVPVAQPLDFGFKSDSRSTSATGRYQAESPTPGHLREVDDVLANNVQPNDRGKATALGLFNKPAREFDEQQFNQRQLQMYEKNMSSLSNNSRSASRASEESLQPRQNSAPTITSPNPPLNNHDSQPQVPPVPVVSASPAPSSNRASKASGRSTPPRPRSKSASAVATANVKARVESLIRKQNAELAALETEKLGDKEVKPAERLSENKENCIGAFFDNDEDDDETELDEYHGFGSSRGNSSKVDESDIHPAFRNSYRISDGQSRRSLHSNFSKTRSVLDDEHNDGSRLQVPTRASEHVGQQTGFGLSGLIRTHLRHDSDRSSIIPRLDRPESSVAPPTTEPSRNGSIASTSRTAADSLRSDPFDLDINRRQSAARISQAPSTPTTAMSQVAQQFLSQAKAMKDAVEKEKVEIEADTVETDTSSKEKSWHDDLEPKHQRGESSETTKERREFDEELAERRRKIKEGLKSVTERERSQSPANASRGQTTGTQTLVQQRSVTDPQPKAMKMLGLQTRNGQFGGDDERGRNVNESRGRTTDSAFHAKQTATFARFEPESTSERPHLPRSATPPANRTGTRARSNSHAGEVLKSRTRPREIDPPLPSGRGYFGNWNQALRSPADGSNHEADTTMGVNNSHDGVKSPPYDLMTRFPVRPSPKPSPISPHSPYDPPLEASRPSPGPPANGRTTPSNGRTTPNAYGRKRSVTKTMISEPKFVSSTSSVPLVHLPEAQQNPAMSTPPLPLMNPRRGGNKFGDKPVLSPRGPAFSRSTPLEPVPASPVITDFSSEATGRKTNSLSPQKLRKANSEGGSMAAKARQQAMAAELAQEKARSPALPVFPNHSATALGMSGDGAMF